jgi:oligopeptide/dipeptide ABC transporter ATP-binding protein
MTPVLRLAGLSVELRTRQGRFQVVSDLDLDVAAGEVVALVGESGSGKSMTALAAMHLLPDPPARLASGSIALLGQETVGLGEAALAKLRGDRMGMVFQEPMTALNPSMRIGDQVAEVLALHRALPRGAAREAAARLLARVRIPDAARRLDDYPHRMSGGMRQRVMIAMALACDPALLIADEPTTALDPTTQAGILHLFREIAEEGRGVLLITHDLGVVAEVADRVAVMYGGRIVESAALEALLAAPQHPYAIGLLGALPDAARPPRGRLTEIPGTVPAPWALPAGCAFAPRCPRADGRCAAERPPLAPLRPGHEAACWHPGMATQDAA